MYEIGIYCMYVYICIHTRLPYKTCANFSVFSEAMRQIRQLCMYVCMYLAYVASFQTKCRRSCIKKNKIVFAIEIKFS